jgi:predicted enzyme related to lactoylglutathione lyase
MVNIDCDAPRALADFYHQILGWDITHSEDDYAMITEGPVSIGFGRIDGYTPPRWPDPSSPKQFHLDFVVADLDKAEAACLDAGAAKPDSQPGGDSWRVLTDPSGHPFCICAKQED